MEFCGHTTINFRTFSVQFSCSVMSDFLQPHGLQHARLSCPSPSPRACSNSCPLSWWCHPTISSSVVPFSSHLQSFPHSHIQSFRVFSNETVLHIRWPKYWSFSFNISFLPRSMDRLISWLQYHLQWFWSHHPHPPKQNKVSHCFHCFPIYLPWSNGTTASPVVQRLKCLPSVRETWVRSLGLGRSPGEGNGNPLQYSCLENPMEGRAWQATVHGVAKVVHNLATKPPPLST